MFSLNALHKYLFIDNEKVFDRDGVQLGLTIYKTPPRTPIDVGFWKTDAIIGQAITSKTERLVDTSFPTRWLSTQIIMYILGYDSWHKPNDVGTHSIFSDVTFEKRLDLAEKILQFFSEQRLNNFATASIESTMDYSKGSGDSELQGDNIIRFIVAIHPFNDPSYVFMTMRVDYDMDTQIAEHRHIQTSLKAVVNSYVTFLDKTLPVVPPVPGRLSMLMHVVVYRILKKQGYAYKQMIVVPLPSMLRILQKAGFASTELDSTKVHRIMLDSKMLLKLHTYLSQAQRAVITSPNINSCISCINPVAYQCKYCKQAILCAACCDQDVHECN